MRLRSFSVSAELVMAVLAILSIFLVVVDTVAIGPGEGQSFARAVDLVICGVFAFDFFTRLRESSSRRVFVRENWYEPLAFVPAVAFSAVTGLPVLSSALRALRLIRVVRVVFVAARMRHAFSSVDLFFARSHLLYVGLIVSGIVVMAAFTVLALELRQPGSQIQDISDALWWSLATVTTVGYGDIVPVTFAGRIVGMLFMMVGIGVMAALIAQVSATLVEARIAKQRDMAASAVGGVARLQQEVGRLAELSDAELALLLKDIVESHNAAQSMT